MWEYSYLEKKSFLKPINRPVICKTKIAIHISKQMGVFFFFQMDSRVFLQVGSSLQGTSYRLKNLYSVRTASNPTMLSILQQDTREGYPHYVAHCLPS